MTRQEFIEDALCNTVNDADILELWNMYCDDNRYDDDHIYDMCEFDCMAEGYSPTDLVNNLDDFDVNDDYFVIGIYGFKSFDDIYEIVSNDDLARWIDDNDDDNGTGILDSYEEEYGEDDEEDDE